MRSYLKVGSYTWKQEPINLSKFLVPGKSGKLMPERLTD